VAESLNAAGLHTPQKTRTGEVSWWTAQTLGPMILNPRYAGIRARTIRPKQGRPTWEIVGPAAWPAIVSEDTWRAVADRLSAKDRRTAPAAARALLTGIALCGVCGTDAPATVHQGRNTSGQRIYRCSAHDGHIGRQADPVDEWIGGLVVRRLSMPDARSLLEAGTRPGVEALRTRAMTLRERREGLAALLADGTLSVTSVREQAAALSADLAKVERELTDAGRAKVLGPLVGAENVRTAWESLDTDRQRAVVDALVSVVLLSVGRGARTFRPETVLIEWRTD
jgi:hypothetical protein